jgi:hypothetical protein
VRGIGGKVTNVNRGVKNFASHIFIPAFSIEISPICCIASRFCHASGCSLWYEDEFLGHMSNEHENEKKKIIGDRA